MADMVPISRTNNLPAEGGLFSPRDLAYVAFRRKRWILAIWLPIVLLGIPGLFKHTGAFVSSSKVLLELQSSQNPSLDISSRNVNYDLAISTYTNLAMSVPVAELAATNLQDSLAVLAEINPEYAKLKDHGKLIEFILDPLTVSRVGESNLLDIQYKSPEERTSLMVNRAVRDAFMDYSVYAGRNSRAISYYTEMVQNAEAEIDSLLAVREAISRETGISMLQHDSQPTEQLFSELRAKYYDIQSEVRETEANIAVLTTALEKDPEFIPSGPEFQHLASMRDRLANETEIYYQLLADHPEGSQKVQRQQSVLSGLRTEMRGDMMNHLESLKLQASVMRAKGEVLEQQMKEVNGSLAAVPSAYRRITMLDAQVATRSELLEGLQIKSGEVRMAELADARVSRLTVITEPEIDVVISESRKFALFGALVVFALGLGLMIGVVVDRSDHRIHDARVLSKSVEVPVLGSISVSKRS